MIDYAGIAVFVFGNKLDASGNVILSNGMKQEFDLCVQAGVKPLPIGATGFIAEELWTEVSRKMDSHYPGAKPAFKAKFRKLGDHSLKPAEIVGLVMDLIDMLQKAQ